MKILKEGINMSRWWVGMQADCKCCGCVVELEEGDRDKESCIGEGKTPCPNKTCGGTIYFSYQKRIKENANSHVG